jgi:hypothetical protein
MTYLGSSAARAISDAFVVKCPADDPVLALAYDEIRRPLNDALWAGLIAPIDNELWRQHNEENLSGM